MEQNLLLTAERLKPGVDLQRGWTSHGRFVIKNVPAQTYLAVSLEQARVLEAFGEGATVPEVFARLLNTRRCLPLREFYELVLKALQAGVLCSGAMRKPARRAIAWPSWAPDVRWLWLLSGAASAALLGLGWRAASLSGWSWSGCAGGLVAALGALSVGQLLAATVLAGFGGEIYQRPPRESLASLHPRLDLRDAALLRPTEQALVLLAAQMPLSAAVLVALIWFPAATLPLAVAWMLVWRPWGEGIARRVAALLDRCPRLDTDSHFLFRPNQGPQRHWRPWWRRWDWRVCAMELVWAGLWTVLAARLAVHAFGAALPEVPEADAGYWLGAASAVGAALLVALGTVMARRWRAVLGMGWRELSRRWERHRRRRRDHVFPETEAALLRVAAGHPLLSHLNPYDRAAVVRSWRPATFSSRTVMAAAETGGHHVGLIFSGAAVANRFTSSGRRVRALALEEGDLFGLPHGLRPDGGEESALEFRAITPVAAMMMPLEVFQQCVVDKLGAKLVYDLTYKFTFFQRLKLCAHWDAHAIGRFARLAQLAVYQDGENIVREGEDTKWLYILYQGSARVRRGDRVLARLKAGDFFGEISLLQNSAAVADVVAQGAVRCLQIDRASFLRFMTHNHHVALALERISSARLGHPIFPLKLAPLASAHPFADTRGERAGSR